MGHVRGHRRGVAGALVGLLFVSISIRIDVISASPDFRSRAGGTLCLLMTVVLVGVLLAIPDQRQWGSAAITGFTLGTSTVLLVVMLAIATVTIARELGTRSPRLALERARGRLRAA